MPPRVSNLRSMELAGVGGTRPALTTFVVAAFAAHETALLKD